MDRLSLEMATEFNVLGQLFWEKIDYNFSPHDELAEAIKALVLAAENHEHDEILAGGATLQNLVRYLVGLKSAAKGHKAELLNVMINSEISAINDILEHNAFPKINDCVAVLADVGSVASPEGRAAMKEMWAKREAGEGVYAVSIINDPEEQETDMDGEERLVYPDRIDLDYLGYDETCLALVAA